MEGFEATAGDVDDDDDAVWNVKDRLVTLTHWPKWIEPVRSSMTRCDDGDGDCDYDHYYDRR